MASQLFHGPKNMSINDKINILKELNAGLTPTTISQKYVISIDPILWVEKKRISILELYQSEYYKLAEKMPLSKGIFPYMENILYQWYLQQMTHITNMEFLEKARSIIAITGEQQRRGGRPFIGTSSWVTGFKKRYNIKLSRKPNQAAKHFTSTVRNTPILNARTSTMADIKNEQSTDQSIINEGIFFNSTMIQVKIDDVDTQPDIIQPSKVNETRMLNPQSNPQLNSRPIVLAVDQPSSSVTKPQESVKKPSAFITKRTQSRKMSVTTPNWAVRVFGQALKWAKENPTDEGDLKVLRKLHSRCIMSLNATHKVKRESKST